MGHLYLETDAWAQELVLFKGYRCNTRPWTLLALASDISLEKQFIAFRLCYVHWTNVQNTLEGIVLGMSSRKHAVWRAVEALLHTREDALGSVSSASAQNHRSDVCHLFPKLYCSHFELEHLWRNTTWNGWWICVRPQSHSCFRSDRSNRFDGIQKSWLICKLGLNYNILGILCC